MSINCRSRSHRRSGARGARGKPCLEMLEDRSLLSVSMVRDINASGGSSPDTMVDVNGTLYFVAADEASGREVWRSDGTTEGTALVRDIRRGTASSVPSRLIGVGGRLYFLTNGAVPDGPRAVWRSDGTAEGTVAEWTGGWRDTVHDLTASGDTLFFRTTFLGIPPPSCSPASTFWRIAAQGAQRITCAFVARDLTVVGGTLFFVRNNAASGWELWKSNGTAAGTVLVKDINPGAASSDPANLTAVGNTLYFTADNGVNGRELWKSDGTEAGTTLVVDILPGSESAFPQNSGFLTNIDGTLYFSATDGRGVEPWRSNGTAAGTVMVADINPGAEGSYPVHFTAWMGHVAFVAATGQTGYEVWHSDGSAAGTQLVRDINSGPADSYPDSLTAIGARLYFSADNGQSGRELWASDGTAEGTRLVADIYPGSLGSTPTALTRVGCTLYFSANNGVHGHELWKLQPSGTKRCLDLRAQPVEAYGLSPSPRRGIDAGPVAVLTSRQDALAPRFPASAFSTEAGPGPAGFEAMPAAAIWNSPFHGGDWFRDGELSGFEATAPLGKSHDQNHGKFGAQPWWNREIPDWFAFHTENLANRDPLSGTSALS